MALAAKVVGLGAGGHAKVVIEALRFDPAIELVGLLDPRPELRGQLVLGVPVLGGDDQLAALRGQGVSYFFIGVGGADCLAVRRRLFGAALDTGLEPVTAIHPRAWVSDSVTVGRGITVLASAVVNACVRLGDNVVVNSGAVVEHDCAIGDHAHVAPGACIAGGVSVGEATLIGMGACVRQGIRVGSHAVVGAGAVVIRDVPDGTVVVGVPASTLRRKEP
jgi:UDP-perosamine 4-acetyltransferase